MTSRKHWLIIGLGNPGPKYTRTRHNLGARVVERLRGELQQPAFRARADLHARVSRGSVLLALPTTFMNESGRAARALVKKYRVPLDHLLVIHDEKDLAFGKLKLQRGRSSAGHRGVQSVIDALGTQDFWRLRVGIGPPPADTSTDDFVLSAFSAEEAAALRAGVMPKVFAAIRRLVESLPPGRPSP